MYTFADALQNNLKDSLKYQSYEYLVFTFTFLILRKLMRSTSRILLKLTHIQLFFLLRYFVLGVRLVL